MIEIKRKTAEKAQMPVKRTETGVESFLCSDSTNIRTDSKNASERKFGPNTGILKNISYSAIYRAVYDYHEAHYPPAIDREYWRTHTPGVDDTPQIELDYWAQALKDANEIAKRFGNDAFVYDLLGAVYCNALAKQYEEGRQAASQANHSLQAESEPEQTGRRDER